MSNQYRNRRDKDTRLGLIFVLLLQPIIYALVLMLFVFCGCSTEEDYFDTLVYSHVFTIRQYIYNDTIIRDTVYDGYIKDVYTTKDTTWCYRTYYMGGDFIPDTARADSLITSDQLSFSSTK